MIERKPKIKKSQAAPKVGRPSGYQTRFAQEARKLCELGATDQDLADFFSVSIRTISNWQAVQPEFLLALKLGKQAANDRVERSLYHRAVGYTYDAVKVFQFQGQPVVVPYREHVPPDTTAMIFWLKNRRKDEWRDRQEHEHTGPGGSQLVPILNVTVAEQRADSS